MSISTNIGVNVQQRRGKRPGRKEIPDHDKEEIFRLAEHERLSTAEIARRVGRDSRTVRRHLGDRARTLAVREGHVQVFRAAMERHQEDLYNLLGAIGAQIHLPDHLVVTMPDPLREVSRQVLYRGLQQHLERAAALWRAVASWTHAATEWNVEARSLWEGFLEDLNTRSGIPLAGSVFEGDGWHRGGLRQVVGQATLREISIGSQRWPPGTVYQREDPKAPPRQVVSMDDIDILFGAPAELPAEPLDRLSDAWLSMRDSEEMKRLRDSVWPGLRRAHDDAILELQTYSLRRLLPGSCRFCPV